MPMKGIFAAKNLINLMSWLRAKETNSQMLEELTSGYGRKELNDQNADKNRRVEELNAQKW